MSFFPSKLSGCGDMDAGAELHRTRAISQGLPSCKIILEKENISVSIVPTPPGRPFSFQSTRIPCGRDDPSVMHSMFRKTFFARPRFRKISAFRKTVAGQSGERP